MFAKWFRETTVVNVNIYKVCIIYWSMNNDLNPSGFWLVWRISFVRLMYSLEWTWNFFVLFNTVCVYTNTVIVLCRQSHSSISVWDSTRFTSSLKVMCTFKPWDSLTYEATQILPKIPQNAYQIAGMFDCPWFYINIIIIVIIMN